MPDEIVTTDAQLDHLIEQVREQHGIESREAAMEFLLKRRLRRGAHQLSGRGRAIYPVRTESKSQ